MKDRREESRATKGFTQRSDTELDTQVLVKLDGPFGEVTVASGTMRPIEAAMTSADYKVGETYLCKILDVKLVAVRKR